eukprot:jgi/Tetstr1/463644/TSEL_008505.t1
MEEQRSTPFANPATAWAVLGAPMSNNISNTSGLVGRPVLEPSNVGQRTDESGDHRSGPQHATKLPMLHVKSGHGLEKLVGTMRMVRPRRLRQPHAEGAEGRATYQFAMCVSTLEVNDGAARFNADDGFLVGLPEHLWPALHAFRTSIKASVGLEVRFDKMQAYSADKEAARREAPADIEWPELDGHHGIAVLNVPLGSS